MKWGRSTGASVEHSLQEKAGTFDLFCCRHTTLAKKKQQRKEREQTECPNTGSFDPNDTSDFSEVLVAYMSPLCERWVGNDSKRVGRGHKKRLLSPPTHH